MMRLPCYLAVIFRKVWELFRPLCPDYNRYIEVVENLI